MATQNVTITARASNGKTFSTVVQVADPVVLAGFPDASTTGTKVTTLKAYTGSYNLTSTVAKPVILDGLILTDDLQVSGPGIIIRNCKSTDQSFWPLRATGTAASPAQIIDNTFISGASGQCSIKAENAVILRNDVSGAGDGIHPCANTITRDNYVHNLVGSSDSHRDGILSDSPGNVIIQHNTIFVLSGQTSCITIERDNGYSGPYDNALVDNNLCAGGGYCIVGPVTGTNVRITNNKFSKVLSGGPTWPKYGQYGWNTSMPSGTVISGNVDYETGAALK